MRISDGSSDVCSSDLVGQGQAVRSLAAPAAALAAAAFLALGAGRGRLAELADPGAAVLVVVHQHVGRHDAGQLFLVQRVHDRRGHAGAGGHRSEEHTSELQSLMRISYAVFCLKKKTLTTK